MNTRHFAVIGYPIAHTLSPVMHNAAFRALGIHADYTAAAVPGDPESLREFARRARVELSGFNVTVPHKQYIGAHLDEISAIGKMTGSVNTVAVRDGVMTGTSTDGAGFEQAVREAFGYTLSGGSIAVIGAGGAARAVAFHAMMQGTAKLAIINRTVENADRLCGKLREHFPAADIRSIALDDADAVADVLRCSDLAVQCTSLGLQADDPEPVSSALFPRDILFFDAIYRETRLQAALRSKGNRVSDGLGMLLYQGGEAFRCWFPDVEPPVEVMRTALSEALVTH